MNKLAHERRVRVATALLKDAPSERPFALTGIVKKTVTRLLADIGEVCESCQDRVLRNLPCRRIQLDELWGFDYCKAKNVTQEIASKISGAGDVWLWVAIDPESKLVPRWQLGDRSASTAIGFVHYLEDRLSNRVQLTSDGHGLSRNR
jgi:hypothetical protein